jgi:hypothetical protein
MTDLRSTASTTTLSDVPEESFTPTSSHLRSPYRHASALSIGSSSTFHGGPVAPTPRSPSIASMPSVAHSPHLANAPHPPRSPGPNGPRRPSSRALSSGSSIGLARTADAIPRPHTPSSTSLRARTSDGTLGAGSSSAPLSAREPYSREPSGREQRGTSSGTSRRHREGREPDTARARLRTVPKLPHDKDAKPAPSTVAYWSALPVHGLLPNHGMRAHTANLVDAVAWVFGGCDDKGCWNDVWCLDTGESCASFSAA